MKKRTVFPEETVDKLVETDIISSVNIEKAMTKLAMRNRHEARGETVRAPCPRRRAATLEQPAMSRTVHPRYRMAKMSPFWGIIRVVP